MIVSPVRASGFIKSLLTIFALVLLMEAAPRVAKSLQQEARNGPLISVQFATNNFRIPRFYFSPQDVPGSTSPQTMLIHALWPDMSPMREDNKQRYAHVNGHGDVLIILVLDQSQATTLEFQLNSRQKLAAPFARQDDIYGLQFFLPTDFHASEGGEGRQAIYVDKTDAGLRSFIRCSVDGSVPEPGCTAKFNYKGMLLDVTYGKYFLPQWREIEQATKALFDSFEMRAGLSGPGFIVGASEGGLRCCSIDSVMK
jgi:hypothetical protein